MTGLGYSGPLSAIPPMQAKPAHRTPPVRPPRPSQMPKRTHGGTCERHMAYNPPYEKIKAKYFEKFRGKGGDGDDEGTTVKSGEAGPSSAAGQSQACASPSSDAGLLPFGLLRAATHLSPSSHAHGSFVDDQRTLSGPPLRG